MSEAQFWVKYFQSRYFWRDKGRAVLEKGQAKPMLLMICSLDMRSPEMMLYRSRQVRKAAGLVEDGRGSIHIFFNMKMWWIPRRRPLQGF